MEYLCIGHRPVCPDLCGRLRRRYISALREGGLHQHLCRAQRERAVKNIESVLAIELSAAAVVLLGTRPSSRPAQWGEGAVTRRGSILPEASSECLDAHDWPRCYWDEIQNRP